MAATEPNPSSEPLPRGEEEPLSAAALSERLAEEILRAERHGTALSCLLVAIDGIEEMAREHGVELPAQTLSYIAGALRRELRRFDRVGRPSERELAIVLPGADGARGEAVARRVLERMRTIKVEAGGSRRPLAVSVGLAAWSTDMGAHELLERGRAAARRRNGDANGSSAGLARRTAAPAREPGGDPGATGPPPGS